MASRVKKKKLKTPADPCPFCARVRGIILFKEEKDIGLSCPRCGILGPRVYINMPLDDDQLWELAVKAWNKRTKIEDAEPDESLDLGLKS